MPWTPGPYNTSPPGGPAGPFYGLVNQRGNVVALQIPKREDADLLASAPDLYAACEAARHVLDGLGEPEDRRNGAAYRRVYRALESALAKARGETQ